ncbi:MAG: proline dehydrogenase, partial [Gemmatimonadota bacterium]
MLRRSLLWLSEQPRIFRFVRRNRLARGFARRFVAGETAAEGIAAVQGLAARGITGTLDLLGESVAVAADAEAACQAYLDILDRLGSTDGVEVNVSLKLTQMGFDISEDLCLANVTRIVERIARLGGFLRLDM